MSSKRDKDDFNTLNIPLFPLQSTCLSFGVLSVLKISVNIKISNLIQLEVLHAGFLLRGPFP